MANAWNGTPSFKIVCYRQNGRNTTIRRGLTLAEAQAWCSRADTRGDRWFHGYTAE